MKPCPVCQYSMLSSCLECPKCGYLFTAPKANQLTPEPDLVALGISRKPFPATQRKEFRGQAQFGTVAGSLAGILGIIMIPLFGPGAIVPFIMSAVFWRIAYRNNQANQNTELYTTTDTLLSFEPNRNESTATFARIGMLDVPAEFCQFAKVQRDYRLAFTPNGGILVEWNLLPEHVTSPTVVPNTLYQKPIVFPLSAEQRRWLRWTMIALSIAGLMMFGLAYSLIAHPNWFDLIKAQGIVVGGMIGFVTLLPFALVANHASELNNGKVYIQTIQLQSIVYDQTGAMGNIQFAGLPKMYIIEKPAFPLIKNEFYSVTYTLEAKYIWEIAQL